MGFYKRYLRMYDKYRNSHTSVEIDHEIISMVILLLPLIQEGSVSGCKLKYVHEVLVNRLVKLAQEKSVNRLTDRLDMTIAVDKKTKKKSTEILCTVPFNLFNPIHL